MRRQQWVRRQNSQEALDAGAIVITHPVNLGAGGGIRTGLEFGYQNKFDFLAVLAGDNQDDPKDLYEAVDKLIDGNFDYIQGSRWLKGERGEYDHVPNTFNMGLFVAFPNYIQN